MFLQQEHTQQLLTINTRGDKELRRVLSILANSGHEQMVQGFERAIRENPHDSTPHHIYADYLEERGNPEEAHAHRILGYAKEGREDPKLGLTLDTAAQKSREAGTRAMHESIRLLPEHPYNMTHDMVGDVHTALANLHTSRGEHEAAKLHRLSQLATKTYQQVLRNKQQQVAAKGYSHERGPVGIRENAELLSPGQTLYHADLTDRNGRALRVRVNGKIKLWKRDPNNFKVPTKYGFYGRGIDITPRNAHEWLLHDPTEEQ